MSSIHSGVRRMGRRWRGVLGAAGLAMLAVSMGCQPVSKGTVGAVNTEPIALDEAMLVRDWPLTNAYYPNGAVQTWPVGFWVEASEDLPWFGSLVVEPALFVGQTLLLPVSYVLVPPWTPVIYHGVEIPASYTAVPPLPPAPPQVVAHAEPADGQAPTPDIAPTTDAAAVSTEPVPVPSTSVAPATTLP